MTKLTYRGKAYSQSNKAAKKQYVELTYRRNVYSNRKMNTSKNPEESCLTYRGVNYS